jgi:Ca-activated chloride channel family protein
MHLRFENPLALWGLLAVLGLAVLILYQARRYPGSPTARRLTTGMLAFLCCVLGLARPQWGTRVTTTQARQSNLFIALDISRSMLAQDTSPSRLAFAVTYARKLLEKLPGVKVAIFPFALDGYLLIPLTTDIPAASDMLTSLGPGMTTAQGSDLTGSLSTLLRHIARMETIAKEKGGEWAATQVLLLSDGESHVRLDDSVLRQYKSRRIPVFTVAVGTTTGTTIPIETRSSWQPRDNVRDPSGRPVVTRMHPETMKHIAEATGGDYFSPRFEEVSRTATRITQAMQLGRLSATFKLEREYYPQLFAAALVIFLLEFAFGRWELAVRALAWLLVPLCCFLPRPLHAEGESGDSKRAAQAYNEGVSQIPGNLQKAVELFQEAAGSATDPGLRKQALYNLGNVFLRMGDPAQALLNYQQAFDSHAGDKKLEQDANQRISENIVLATKMEQQMKQQQQQQGKSSEEDGEQKKGQAEDPKGPRKNYQAQNFDENQKQKIFDLLSSEEQQILQRLQEQKGKKDQSRPTDKPW